MNQLHSSLQFRFSLSDFPIRYFRIDYLDPLIQMIGKSHQLTIDSLKCTQFGCTRIPMTATWSFDIERRQKRARSTDNHRVVRRLSDVKYMGAAGFERKLTYRSPLRGSLMSTPIAVRSHRSLTAQPRQLSVEHSGDLSRISAKPAIAHGRFPHGEDIAGKKLVTSQIPVDRYVRLSLHHDDRQVPVRTRTDHTQ